VERQIEKSKSVPLFEPPAGLIYHYTGQSGLLGILKDRQIWASHLRFLNDTQEYYAGRSFLERVVAVMRATGQADEQASEMVEKLLTNLDGHDIYTASFADEDAADSLDLWRGYARTVPGYSLGFVSESLREALVTTVTNRPRLSLLGRVHYIPGLGEQYRVEQPLLGLAVSLKDVILELKKTDIHNLTSKDKVLEQFVLEVYTASRGYARIEMMMAFLLPLLKHEGFANEREYRLVHVRVSDKGNEHRKDIGFHPGQSSIVPHVTISLPGEDLAIQRIVVGPCPDPSWAVRAVEMLLERHSIKVRRNDDDIGVKVVPSKIPYRNW
jgi:hypothetical protein